MLERAGECCPQKGFFLKKKKKSLRGAESWDSGRPRFHLILEAQGALCEKKSSGCRRTC